MLGIILGACHFLESPTALPANRWKKLSCVNVDILLMFLLQLNSRLFDRVIGGMEEGRELRDWSASSEAGSTFSQPGYLYIGGAEWRLSGGHGGCKNAPGTMYCGPWHIHTHTHKV